MWNAWTWRHTLIYITSLTTYNQHCFLGFVWTEFGKLANLVDFGFSCQASSMVLILLPRNWIPSSASGRREDEKTINRQRPNVWWSIDGAVVVLLLQFWGKPLLGLICQEVSPKVEAKCFEFYSSWVEAIYKTHNNIYQHLQWTYRGPTYGNLLHLPSFTPSDKLSNHHPGPQISILLRINNGEVFKFPNYTFPCRRW